MTRVELVNAVAEKTGMTKKDTNAMLSATLDAIVTSVAAGDKVTLVGFGTFEQRERAARQGINPSTKEKVEYPATVVPKFKAGKAFKEAVAK